MAAVTLISTYELGRQPFGLASAAAWLRGEGAEVTVQDLAIHAFEPEPVRDADMVGVYMPMHTATRLGEQVITRVGETNPTAHVVAFGLYAPMNEPRLRRLGADTIIGGEFEEPLAATYRSIASGSVAEVPVPTVSLERQTFLVPDRSGLPEVERYAHMHVPGVGQKKVGSTEASRGCKHLCRHCPIVPVYGGRFFPVPVDVVVEDIHRQVAAGAEHITFGDPDFFNGPAHAMRIVRRLHDQSPNVTYDVTIKVEHLVADGNLLAELRDTGCILITTAVESFDDTTLERFAKGHSSEDIEHALAMVREAGIAVNPTFVAFTPWTTIDGYLAFLRRIADLDLVEAVSPIQYAIRLLLPEGSLLLDLPEIAAMVDPFDEAELAYPWTHPEPAVDRLTEAVLAAIRSHQQAGASRSAIFDDVWGLAAASAGSVEQSPRTADVAPVAAVPYLTEPWYC